MQRLVPLEGGRNFRDLGGYRTHDGHRVRWRVLFRSGVLSYLTGEDWRQLSGLGVRTVCDLRAPHERARERIHDIAFYKPSCAPRWAVCSGGTVGGIVQGALFELKDDRVSAATFRAATCTCIT